MIAGASADCTRRRHVATASAGCLSSRESRERGVFVSTMASYHEAKICILGDSGVGKSSLVQRFVHNTFTLGNESTIGASFLTKTVVVGDKTIKFNIWDTGTYAE